MNNVNNYQKLDDNLILNNLIDFLYFKDNIELSKTNKNNRLLFKKVLKKNKIKKIIIGSIFRPKLWSEFEHVLNSLEPPENLMIPPDMIEILDYSITKNTIKYRYIPVGRYKHIFYPILNEKIKLLSIHIQYPQIISPIVENIDIFYNKWEKIKDNSHIVYSVNYIHPLLKYSLFKTVNILAFSFMFFLCYFIFVFFFILMKNNFMVKDSELININLEINDKNMYYDYNDIGFVPIFNLKQKFILLDSEFIINTFSYQENDNLNMCYNNFTLNY